MRVFFPGRSKRAQSPTGVLHSSSGRPPPGGPHSWSQHGVLSMKKEKKKKQTTKGRKKKDVGSVYRVYEIWVGIV